ncbi:MAG TPA: hypothetical protein VE172_25250 [Stackebrandtia sp.]|uniref:DUF7927 domain-containing protein n=1 Tax=Stackebrandtia sp. TaxID=2023065 RepID=UPI002D7292F7|nr:hypothetical protein [Stackebrandtia sp.]HZE42117.1 hypothetical protein [Stackebrandtia sp.]
MRPVRSLVSSIAVACAATMVAAVGAAPPAHAVIVKPFEIRYHKSLYGDFETVGNTVQGCPATPADVAAKCAATQQGQGTSTNNEFAMRGENFASMSGAFNSSSATVPIPSGAKVDYARLFWGGNDGTYKGPSGSVLNRCDITQKGDVTTPSGDPGSTPVLVDAGNGAASVSPRIYSDETDLNGPHYYTAEAEVTKQLASATGDTTVKVGNVWAPDGLGCVGGWSLVVVYAYPEAKVASDMDKHEVYVYGGHVVQRSRDPELTTKVSGFYRIGDDPVRASVTGYEGDRATAGDRFAVNGTNLAEPHTGATNNFFISASDGPQSPNYANNLDVDAKQVDVPESVIPAGATSADLTLKTSGDTYVVQELALAVPAPDLKVTKKASPTRVRPGDTVTYTVTAKNVGRVASPGAHFSDDLSDVLDDATTDGAPTATTGTVTYKEPKVEWTGDLDVGQSATVTYKVRVNDPLSGDGKLNNDVIADSTRATCQNADEPGCFSDIDISSATPSPSASKPSGHHPKPADHSEPGPRPSGLPVTGLALTPLIWIGCALILLGAAGWVFARRRWAED